MRRLIVNADDFGLSPAVTGGIIEAHRNGIVTSTTMMVNFPTADHAAALALESPNLGVGVHLNVTSGPPVLRPEEVPSLVGPSGRFRRDYYSLRYRVDADELRREWRAQIEKFLALGLRPTHIDSHHHVHHLPPFLAVAMELAREYGIGRIRLVHQQDLRGGFSINPTELLYRRYARRAETALAEADLRTPDRVLGCAVAAGEPALTVDRLITWLRNLSDGTSELMCHPGYVDQDLRYRSSLLEHRVRELEALTDPAVKAAVAANGIELVTYSAL
ncbi:MAG: carbohydrate deacetylase [Chloroflexota bacterium]